MLKFPNSLYEVQYEGVIYSPCYRSKLAALRQQLCVQETPHDGEMSISSDEAQQETTQTTEFSIPCPSCGRAMQRHQSIRPQRRHPP